LTNPGKNKPPPLNWRELRALWPLLILLALVITWVNLQFGTLWSLVKTSVAFAVIGALLKFLWPSFADGVRTDFANALRSRKIARALWIATPIFIAASFLVGSARVKAEKVTRAVAIYRIEANGRAPVAGRKMLDALHSSQQSFYIPLPFKKRVLLASTNNEISRALTVYPWAVPSVTYPTDFASLPELAVLLSPNLRPKFGAGRWLRLVVLRESPSPKVLAEDTLRTFQSRMVVFDTSALSDDAAKARWLALASDSLSLDAGTAPLVVDDWLKRRPLRTSEPLLPDQRIRLILLNQNNDTVKSARVTLTPGLSNVVLHK
jgi:hypothetical protein